MEFSPLVKLQGKHSEELRTLQETKNSIITQAKAKQIQNNKIFSSIQDLAPDLEELDKMLSSCSGNPTDPDLLQEISSLKREYEEFQSQLNMKKQTFQLNNIEKICSDIEKIYNEILKSSSEAKTSPQPNPSSAELISSNLTDIKKQIDKNQELIAQNEQVYSNESREVEDLRKEIESLMKLKHLKEFEIKTMIKREEHERRIHDEHLEELNEQKKMHRAISVGKPGIGSQAKENLELLPDFNSSVQTKNTGDAANSIFFLLTSVILLIGITFFF